MRANKAGRMIAQERGIVGKRAAALVKKREGLFSLPVEVLQNLSEFQVAELIEMAVAACPDRVMTALMGMPKDVRKQFAHIEAALNA